MAHCSARVALVEMIRTIYGWNFSMSFHLIPVTTSCKLLTTGSARNPKKSYSQLFNVSNRSASERLLKCRTVSTCCVVIINFCNAGLFTVYIETVGYKSVQNRKMSNGLSDRSIMRNPNSLDVASV